MKERPILFSAPMVVAIREGRKTQTRRIVTPQPERTQEHVACIKLKSEHVDIRHPPGWRWRDLFVSDELPSSFAGHMRHHSPYGQPGDRLWVRETWCVGRGYDGVAPRDLPHPETGLRIKLHHLAASEKPSWAGQTRVAIHMPRWASRITLAVMSVRVERLQDITEEDAKAEGVDARPAFTGRVSHRVTFQRLWDGINGNRGFSWASNPWVWVVGFELDEVRG